MALAPGSSTFNGWSANAFGAVGRWIQGLFSQPDFSPEQDLADTKNIDPHLVPRVPMDATNLDVRLLNDLSHIGMRRGKQITDASHPELMQSWRSMCQRTGLAKAPQLILAESPMMQALTISPQEIVVTTELFKNLNLREISAVLGHELGHEISDHRTSRIVSTVALGSAGALGVHQLGQMFLKLENWKQPSTLVKVAVEVMLLNVGWIGGSIMANHIAVKPSELDADRKGAFISGDPLALVSALKKLEMHRENASLKQQWRFFKTGYPTTQHRIKNLEEIATQMHQSGYVEAPPFASPHGLVAAPDAQVTQVADLARLDPEPAAHVLH